MIMVTGLAVTGLIVICLALLATWLVFATKRARIEKGRAVAATFVIGILAWLALIGILAQSGALAAWSARPPRLPLVPLTAFVALITLSRMAIVGKLLKATPRHLPVAMQAFRIGVELCFLGLYLNELAPAQVTFEGRNFDILVGLTAPFVAFAIFRYNVGPRLVIAWNILGLLILANTIGVVLSSVPGPLHQPWPGEPFVALATWPVICIPGFLAPLAIFLHISSIRQNVALTRAGHRQDK